MAFFSLLSADEEKSYILEERTLLRMRRLLRYIDRAASSMSRRPHRDLHRHLHQRFSTKMGGGRGEDMIYIKDDNRIKHRSGKAGLKDLYHEWLISSQWIIFSSSGGLGKIAFFQLRGRAADQSGGTSIAKRRRSNNKVIKVVEGVLSSLSRVARCVQFEKEFSRLIICERAITSLQGFLSTHKTFFDF